jgi:DNA-binding response OmpR family regulator
VALHVAVVEDEQPVRALIETILKGRGYQVETFATASAAWQRLLRTRPNLLILDVGLPDESGLDLLRRLRSLHGPQSYPVLIVSGRHSEQEILLGYEAGADEYLTKPFSSQELLAKCAVLIARCKSTLETEALALASDEPLFDRYETHGILGRGAFGIVYHAYDLHQDSREVALKVCNEDLARDPEHRMRFLRESYALASLDHPSIVSVSDFGMLDSRLYLAMDYVQGPTLSSRVRTEGALNEAETLDMLRSLAGALDTLEQAGLVHRDIKPANIILQGGDCRQPVLVDFGLAKRINERSVTAKSTVVGTPGYIAPEVFFGETADSRSDLFSLGVVAYYALSGAVPFPHLRGVALLMRIARGGLPVLACENELLARALADLLEVERERRLPSARALSELLAQDAPSVL